MSSAEVSRKQEKIVFVWGGSCDVLPGQVRILHYNFNKTPHNYLNETVAIDLAREYWSYLIELGLHQTGDPSKSICPADLLAPQT